MTGIALGLNTLTTSLMLRRASVEAQLMLGATRWDAAALMTGQILSGVPPVEAVKYQILVMFLIAGGTGFGAVAAVLGGIYRLTDARHRLRLDRLAASQAI